MPDIEPKRLILAAVTLMAVCGATGHSPRAAANAPRSVCSTTATGDLVGCPRPLRPAQLPPVARDQAAVSAPVKDPAALADPRTWTSSGGNTFPGADAPFGMVQWSPDTMPDRSDGGGYTFGDRQLWGYSLTHVSGPGCLAAGDIPILPMTGPMPAGDPTVATTPFTNAGEIAQAGYYSARSNGPHPIVSQFTASTHAAMGKFTFPRTSSADFLIKLYGSERRALAPTARIIGHDEVAGSVTSGDFCDESGSFGPQLYTVHFDIVFNRSFTTARVNQASWQRHPTSVFLSFNATHNQVVQARVAISYVSAANARADYLKEMPSWDFGYYRTRAQTSWDRLLTRISVWGGSYARTQEFYSLLYKDLLQPNVVSDVNGQYVGSDQKVHTVAGGQGSQYGLFSGWDTYHSLAQLQALVDPAGASDMAQSLVNDYAQNHILPQWGYLNLDNYVMAGDPADALIGDFYAFGAQHFDTGAALTDMLAQATTVNNVRPGEAAEALFGYLPEDAAYGCCHLHGVVAAQLEYDNADFALAQYAAALGDQADAASMTAQAGDWANLFDPATGLLTARLGDGDFFPGVTATTTANYIEGDAEEYLWDVPYDYAGLFDRLGGDAAVTPELVQYLSQPDGRGLHAFLANEFDLGEQFALDYAGDPAGTQLAVSNIRDQLYRPGPDGLTGNDDLGAESSQFIWEMLGLYPENPGTGTLLLSSPGFPHAIISLASHKTVAINAPGASPQKFYAQSLTISGAADSSLATTFATLSSGAVLDWTLATSPTSWGSDPADAPPSYP